MWSPFPDRNPLSSQASIAVLSLVRDESGYLCDGCHGIPFEEGRGVRIEPWDIDHGPMIGFSLLLASLFNK